MVSPPAIVARFLGLSCTTCGGRHNKPVFFHLAPVRCQRRGLFHFKCNQRITILIDLSRLIMMRSLDFSQKKEAQFKPVAFYP